MTALVILVLSDVASFLLLLLLQVMRRQVVLVAQQRILLAVIHYDRVFIIYLQGTHALIILVRLVLTADQ